MEMEMERGNKKGEGERVMKPWIQTNGERERERERD
jgi:hypothetical protein